MSASRQSGWTIGTFPAWEARQELRYEFDGFQPVAMAGGTFALRTVKNREYAGTASVRRYVMQEQTAAEGMMFTHADADADWIGHILPPGSAVPMPEIGIELPLAEVYAGLDFSDDVADDEV